MEKLWSRKCLISLEFFWTIFRCFWVFINKNSMLLVNARPGYGIFMSPNKNHNGGLACLYCINFSKSSKVNSPFLAKVKKGEHGLSTHYSQSLFHLHLQKRQICSGVLKHFLDLAVSQKNVITPSWHRQKFHGIDFGETFGK